MNTLKEIAVTEAVVIEEKKHRSDKVREEIQGDSISAVMPSKAESMWNVSLLLTAYMIMGGFLTIKLSVDLFSFLIKGF